jgi:hypothetical protein
MAGQFQHVQPGDLITSDLFNRLLDEFEKLRDRVTVLEGTPSVGDVAVLALVPSSGIVRLGEQLVAVGYGFGLSVGACRAFIDDVEVPQFLPGSTDEQLIMIVPEQVGAAAPVPPLGRPGVLVVRGPKGRAQRALTILPVKPAPPGGVGVRLTFQSATPATIASGAAARFRFTATSLVSVPLSVAPSVVFSGVANPAAWLDTAAFVQPDGTTPLPGGRLDLQAGEQDREFVLLLRAVPAVPPTAATVGYTVNVTSNDVPAVTGTSGIRTFTVGQPQPVPDPNFTLAPSTATPPSALSDSTITRPPNTRVDINLTVTLRAAGTYAVAVPEITGTGWTATRNSPATLRIEPGTPVPVTQTLRYTVFAGAALGEGAVTFAVSREGGTVPATVRYQLKPA